MRARSLLASLLAPTLFVACANGSDDSGKGQSIPPFDAGGDTSAVADSSAPTDSATDVIAEDSTSEVASDTASSDGSADSATDSAVAADSALDAANDAATDSATDSAVDSASAADAPSDATVGPYRHSIVIDGLDDFAAGERFSTTSGDASGFVAHVSWDDTSLFVGYDGPDVAGNTTNAGNKWIFVYLDVDPGGATGATSGVKYNTETPKFPSGFGAEYYLRWKSDDSFSTIEQYASGAWSTLTSTVSHKRVGNGTYVEFAIPLSSIGSPKSVGVEALWMNETSTVEGAYAGIYPGNFTDGYNVTVPLTKYLLADFSLSIAPNDPSRQKP